MAIEIKDITEVKLGQTVVEQVEAIDTNFTNLFDAVDDLDQAIDTKEPVITTKNSAFNKSFSTSNPKADGTASAGTATTVARGDHVHPTDTTRLSTNPNGTDNLIVDDKINLVYLPDTVLGQLEYQGTFSAATAGTKSKTKGHYYICSTAGSYNPDGTTGNSYAVGDWAVYNGTSWDKVDNTDAVTMVNGQTGSVKTYKGAYSATTKYYQGDIVLSNGCLYLYINATAASGHAPIVTDYWQIFGKVYSDATQSASGLMSSTDKTKLDSFSISKTAPSSTSTDTTVPTSKAVYSAVSAAQTLLGSTITGIGTRVTNIENGTTTVPKATDATNATNDADGNNIASTYATKSQITGMVIKNLNSDAFELNHLILGAGGNTIKTSTHSIAYAIVDATTGEASSVNIPTNQAVKNYVDAQVSTAGQVDDVKITKADGTTASVVTNKIARLPKLFKTLSSTVSTSTTKEDGHYVISIAGVAPVVDVCRNGVPCVCSISYTDKTKILTDVTGTYTIRTLDYNA